MNDGVAVFQAAPQVRRNGDVDHPYRQDSNFLFLTGFEEPGSLAVFEKSDDKRRYTLFVEPNDPEMVVWIGEKAGVDGAKSDFGADEAYPRSEFFERISGLMSNRDRLYVEFGRDSVFDARITEKIEALKAEARKGITGPWELLDPRTILWEMRLIKSSEDLKAIEKACEITKAAFRAAMRAVRPGLREWELAAVMEFEFARRGSPRVGFETICAAGENATTLHYIENSSRIEDGQLVLMDAGAELDYVTSDISRTFPASGRFTEPGRTVYQWVLRAQEAAIGAVAPGVSYQKVHDTALKVLCRGLKSMGAVDGNLEKIIEEESYKPFFMHRIGHWLGIDVHDVGPYFKGDDSLELREGMVMTIEPGLYFASADPTPEDLRGIGVRIEDDVVVTGSGCRVLTDGLPKKVDDIEALMDESGDWWSDLEPVSV